MVEPPRLPMGIATPREVGGRANGMAAVKRGRRAKIKECEKYISYWKRSENEWKRTDAFGKMGRYDRCFYSSERHCAK